MPKGHLVRMSVSFRHPFCFLCLFPLCPMEAPPVSQGPEGCNLFSRGELPSTMGSMCGAGFLMSWYPFWVDLKGKPRGPPQPFWGSSKKGTPHVPHSCPVPSILPPPATCQVSPGPSSGWPKSPTRRRRRRRRRRGRRQPWMARVFSRAPCYWHGS